MYWWGIDHMYVYKYIDEDDGDLLFLDTQINAKGFEI